MKKYIPVLIVTLVLFIGCEKSVYRLLYNSMDSFIYRAVTWYIEPTPGQDRFLREKIGAHFHWHRRSELVKYAVTLQGIRERMARGLRGEDAAWAMARYRRHEADFFEAISADVASFFATLDGKQIDRLDQRMGERIAEIEKKAGADNDARIREETKSTLRMMEFLYGGLTGPQAEEITRQVRGMENIESLRMRLFRDRRAEFMALLREKPDRNAVRAYLRRLAVNPEQSYPDYYRGPAARRERLMTKAFIKFDHELVTPTQRQRAVGKIDVLVQALRELAVE
jgi:hypothetical protein